MLTDDQNQLLKFVIASYTVSPNFKFLALVVSEFMHIEKVLQRKKRTPNKERK